MTSRQAAIYGLSGLELTSDEIDYISKASPLGFILFSRNINNLEQVSKLVSHLKSFAQNGETLILIDQEGGRVARLRPPLVRDYPPAEIYGNIYNTNPEKALRAAYLGAVLMAKELLGVGINVDCTPCLDLSMPQTSDVIGNRAFSAFPEVVGALGRSVAQGFLDEGALPVIKHIPGHGHGAVDSHEALPIVEASLEVLVEDFAPFRQSNTLPLAMIGHLVFNAIDAENLSTQSSLLIEKIIRGHIGFDGLLMTDDISMKALSPDISITTHAQRALQAGCDVILHCNGEANEMFPLMEMLPKLTGKALDRAEKAMSFLKGNTSKISETLAEKEWRELISDHFPESPKNV